MDDPASAQSTAAGDDTRPQGLFAGLGGFVFDLRATCREDRLRDARDHAHLGRGRRHDAVDVGEREITRLAHDARLADEQAAVGLAHAADDGPHRSRQRGQLAPRVGKRRVAFVERRQHARDNVLEERLFRPYRPRKCGARAGEQIVDRGERVKAIAKVERGGAEAEHVGTAVDRFTAQRLGGHELQRAAHLARRRVFEPLSEGDAEVTELDAGLGRPEEIRRLDVAMDDAGVMRGVKPLGDAGDRLAHVPKRQASSERAAAPLVDLVEIDAVDVFLNEERRLAGETDVERAHHAIAVHAGHEPRLVEHALVATVEARLQRLHDQRDGEQLVAREPDVAHATATDPSPDLVVADLAAGLDHDAPRF